MLQAFIITLREGVEASLIVGIVFAYLSKIGRPELKRTVFWALGSAVAASVAAAIILAHTPYNSDILEGWVMLGAAFFVISMIWFMHRAARTMKGSIEEKVAKYTAPQAYRKLASFFSSSSWSSAKASRPSSSSPRSPSTRPSCLLHRNPPWHSRSRSLRHPLHSRQRQNQHPALLSRHHRHPLLRRLPTHRQRLARAQRKRRPPLQHHRDAPHRPNCPERSLLLRHHARPRRPHDAPRIQAPHNCRPNPRSHPSR